MTFEMKLDGHRYDFVIDDGKIHFRDDDTVAVPLMMIRRGIDETEVRRALIHFCVPDSAIWRSRMSDAGKGAAMVGSECILGLLNGDDRIWPYADASGLEVIMPYTCEIVGREVWNAAVRFIRVGEDSQHGETVK